MAWIQVHQTLKDHRKLFDAADELEISPPHMMGLLISFWLWALDNAPTGSLVDITPRMISRAAQWDGDPEKLAKTIFRAVHKRRPRNVYTVHSNLGLRLLSLLPKGIQVKVVKLLVGKPTDAVKPL